MAPLLRGRWTWNVVSIDYYNNCLKQPCCRAENVSCAPTHLLVPFPMFQCFVEKCIPEHTPMSRNIAILFWKYAPGIDEKSYQMVHKWVTNHGLEASILGPCRGVLEPRAWKAAQINSGCANHHVHGSPMGDVFWYNNNNSICMYCFLSLFVVGCPAHRECYYFIIDLYAMLNIVQSYLWICWTKVEVVFVFNAL